MESGSEKYTSHDTGHIKALRIALVVIALALAGDVVLAYWIGKKVPDQIAKREGDAQLKLLHQAREGLERYIDELRYKIWQLAKERAIISAGQLSDDQQAELDKFFTYMDMSELQIRSFDLSGEQMQPLPVVGQRYPRPDQRERKNMIEWAKTIDPTTQEDVVSIEVVQMPVTGDRQSSNVVRLCTPIWEEDAGAKRLDGVLAVWISADLLINRFLSSAARTQSFVFAVQSTISESEESSPTLLLHSAEPYWIRGGKDANTFLEALQTQTHMFDSSGDHDIVNMPQLGGNSRKEVIAYTNVVLLPHRWTLGVSTPYDVVIGPYSPYRTSLILNILLTVMVLVVLGALTYYEWKRIRWEASEQRRQQLREMQHDYRELFAENPIAMLIINEQEQLADCNYSAERLIGLSKQEVIGKAVTELFDDHSIDGSWESLRDRSFLHARDTELIRCTDQSVVTVEAWGRKIGDYWVIMANDVEQRRDLERQISRLQRMDSMGSLASTLAHDFNNLLGQVQILVSNLRADIVPGCGDVEQDLRAIEEKVDDASQLVANLLAFREDVVSKDPIWLEPVIKEFVAHERKVIPQEIDLEFTIDDETPHVWITPYALRRVLDNLCRNACDAMRYGGELRIRLFARRLTEQQGADRLPAGHYAVIEVSDTGVGMSHEMLDTIFEPFFSTKGQGRGTGLGLWTVYKIVRRAGGTVHVRSRLGKGSRFTIYLPNIKPQEDLS